MITNIETNFSNIRCFEFTGEITKKDFETTVFPALEGLKVSQEEVNMVYILMTDLENFTTAAWLQDALLGLKNIANFKRVAIVSTNESIKQFTEFFSKIMPGEFKGFDQNDEKKAIEWAALGNQLN